MIKHNENALQHNKYHVTGADILYREDYYEKNVTTKVSKVVPSIPHGRRRLIIHNESHTLPSTNAGYMQTVWLFKSDDNSATPNKGTPVPPGEYREIMREEGYIGDIFALVGQGSVTIKVSLTQN